MKPYVIKLFNVNGELMDTQGIMAYDKRDAYIKARENWEFADDNFYVEAEEDYDYLNDLYENKN